MKFSQWAGEDVKRTYLSVKAPHPTVCCKLSAPCLKLKAKEQNIQNIQIIKNKTDYEQETAGDSNSENIIFLECV